MSWEAAYAKEGCDAKQFHFWGAMLPFFPAACISISKSSKVLRHNTDLVCKHFLFIKFWMQFVRKSTGFLSACQKMQGRYCKSIPMGVKNMWLCSLRWEKQCFGHDASQQLVILFHHPDIDYQVCRVLHWYLVLKTLHKERQDHVDVQLLNTHEYDEPKNSQIT